MEEKVKDMKKEINKKKNKKITIIMIILIIIWTMILAANAYASSQGYGNIFFAIKNLISKNETSRKEEIFYDKDITISYSNIEVVDGIEMQINKLQIKDDKSILYVLVNKEEGLENTMTDLPFKYKVYKENEELICNQSGQENKENKYIEELKLDKINMETKYLKLEVYSKNNELLVTFNIDIENKEITVEGQNEAISKLSEIELKDYIGTYIEKTENIPNALCLEIKNITYANNIYTAIFTYCYSERDDFLEIESLDIYEATTRFKYNEDKKEKYEVIELIDKKILVEGTKVENEDKDPKNEEKIVDEEKQGNIVDNNEESIKDNEKIEENEIIPDVSVVRNELTKYLADINNDIVTNKISDFNIQFNKKEIEIEEHKYIEKAMLSRVCSIIVKAKEYEKLSYIEVCNYNGEHANNADERYTIMFMYKGQQTQISASSYEPNCLLFSGYDESKKGKIIYKLYLQESALNLLENLYDNN